MPGAIRQRRPLTCYSGDPPVAERIVGLVFIGKGELEVNFPAVPMLGDSPITVS